MIEIVIALVAAVFGSTGFWAWLSQRSNRAKAIEEKLDKIEEKLDKTEVKLDKTERDAARTQMLLMISEYPNNQEGIMSLAEHYFSRLHGDWYATGLFNKWLEDWSLSKPEWFKEVPK